ncbi:hypothetical protein A8H39_10970 [Paraburkholderia fungorum]|jgi:hypothetical protein|uniref:hypothetical protein n=1 Tax=Paraburkholderia fungorum TaxID=134537 RepID=UPI000480B5D0|nr:hypothetical protein [Paraburkholderia fungorum]MBB5543316.1 hypothetical protein [Paraburkholderia fungorum]PNE56323.1 hypothetical protein A8H39_10970 [Paraburkholderia fungorum]
MSGRVGLYWAWLMLDRFRARQNINARQIEIALAAIETAHGRRPIHGSPTYEFDDEERLRVKVGPR